jgi:hypothetical protein
MFTAVHPRPFEDPPTLPKFSPPWQSGQGPVYEYPLNYKGGMHKAAEEKHASCGFCHYEGGQAFATKGNCAGKCHNNAAKKG